MGQLLKRTFDQGRLVHEETVDVPDPEPTAEELLEARLADAEARLIAVKEALAESSDPKVREVATRIDAKDPKPGRGR